MNAEDRELLELAAKAAGVRPPQSPHEGCIANDGAFVFYLDCEGRSVRKWNPLEDDGDALRLAVNLRLYVSPNISGELAMVFGDIFSKTKTFFEPYGDDPCAATRRAIVRAAAEIGRRMA